VYQDGKAIQELQDKESLPFLDAQKKFLDMKRKSRTFCCS
jgi:hypothetical protein